MDGWSRKKEKEVSAKGMGGWMGKRKKEKRWVNKWMLKQARHDGWIRKKDEK